MPLTKVDDQWIALAADEYLFVGSKIGVLALSLARLFRQLRIRWLIILQSILILGLFGLLRLRKLVGFEKAYALRQLAFEIDTWWATLVAVGDKVAVCSAALCNILVDIPHVMLYLSHRVVNDVSQLMANLRVTIQQVLRLTEHETVLQKLAWHSED